jgi:hypothetical protein
LYLFFLARSDQFLSRHPGHLVPHIPEGLPSSFLTKAYKCFVYPVNSQGAHDLNSELAKGYHQGQVSLRHWMLLQWEYFVMWLVLRLQLLDNHLSSSVVREELLLLNARGVWQLALDFGKGALALCH